MSVILWSAMEAGEPASATLGFPRRFVPGFPLLFFPRRATLASVKTMTRLLTLRLTARGNALVPFDARIVSPVNCA
jgi:hypothetical protein